MKSYTEIMTTLKARFDGQVLVPEQPLELPTDCLLEVTVQPIETATPALLQQRTLDLMRQWEREDADVSPDQVAQDERIAAEIERDGIERTQL